MSPYLHQLICIYDSMGGVLNHRTIRYQKIELVFFPGEFPFQILRIFPFKIRKNIFFEDIVAEIKTPPMRSYVRQEGKKGPKMEKII